MVNSLHSEMGGSRPTITEPSSQPCASEIWALSNEKDAASLALPSRMVLSTWSEKVSPSARAMSAYAFGPEIIYTFS
jgi:hypothetical protein